MAVTGFWPVRCNLNATIKYANNPDKTTAREYHDKELYAALRYIKNDDKTDKEVFVAGINCSKQNAYAEMIAVQRRFGMKGTVIGYHGIQSFAKDSVTPKEAFEIGKETARQMWGDKYQVLVTVHLNTDHLHCHFVVNPCSFVDGKKFKNKISDHLELRHISDKICQEHGLQVLKDSEFYSKGKKAYWVHKQGKKTHRDMLREDINYCIQYSYSWESFAEQMYHKGYEIDWERQSVRAKNWERSVRFSSLGYDLNAVGEYLDYNYYSEGFRYEWYNHQPYKPKHFPLERERERLSFSLEHSYDPATVLVDTMFLILIEVIEFVTEVSSVMLLSPDLRAAEQDINQFRSDYHFLRDNDIHTIPQLERYISKTQTQITDLEVKRSEADNARRRSHTPEEAREAKAQRKAITKKIAPLRKRLKQAQKILEVSPHLYDLLRQEHKLEKAAKQKNERDREWER